MTSNAKETEEETTTSELILDAPHMLTSGFHAMCAGGVTPMSKRRNGPNEKDPYEPFPQARRREA
jgi:hypothetical protein